MARVAATEKVSLNAIQAAARLGVELQKGPLFMRQAILIVADKSEDEWKRLHAVHQAYYRSRTRSLIDSISLVGGLPLAEDKCGTEMVYFLI